MDLQRSKPLRHFIVWDVGVGTVDLVVYQIIRHIAHPDSAEICAWSGANCGSFLLDLEFRELAKRVIDQTLLTHHPVRPDPAPFAYFMHHFSECDKLDYSAVKDDTNMFHLTCLNLDNPTVGLINGQLSISSSLLQGGVLDPVKDQVLQLLGKKLLNQEQPTSSSARRRFRWQRALEATRQAAIQQRNSIHRSPS
ncbi:hypothetical protein H1R20_g16330, partial [Candolleomyces eurysporus]